MRAWRYCAAASILALWSAPALAITINDFTATRNDRFASGYVFTSGTLTSPTPMGPLLPNTASSFIGASYDWSGVGWQEGSGGDTSYALITPRQMLIANHYAPGVGSSIQFASATGQVTTVTVQSQPGTHGGVPPDMATAQFSSAIPQSAGVTTYSILFQGYNPNTYAGDNLLNYGQTAAIGWNQIASVNTGTNYGWQSPFTPDSAYYMNYLYDSTTPDRTQLIGGDSGSPSFIVNGSPGIMYLAGAHYVTDAGASGWDSFLPMSLPALDSDTAPTGYLPSVVTPTTARWTATGSGSAASTWSANGSGNWTLASSGAVFNDVLTSGQVTTCASVLFDGLASSQHSITLSGSLAVTSLAFNLTPSTTSGFTFSGGSLTLGEAGLTNNDIHAQTFNNAISLRTSQQWQTGTGGVTISSLGSLSLGTSQLLYLNGSGTSDFEGVVSGGSSSIAKDGSGTLILGNANNSFSGQIFVHNGTLQFASIQNVGGGNSALGAPTTATNGTIYLAGTLAYVGGGNSSNRVIDVADGPGAAGATGVIDASGAGALNLTGSVTCEDTSGTSLLVLQGSGSGSQSGVIANNSGTVNVMSLIKTGSGTWNLSGANSYTGTTLVNGGLLTVSGPAGSINQSTALTVSRGTVQLDDSALANNFSSSRLGSQPITLQEGTLNVNLGNVSGGTETIGSVTAAVGENTLALSTGSGRGIVNGGSLTRLPGATLNFTGALSGSNGMAFSGMASGSNFISAGAFVNGADYAVYDASGYVRAMVVGPNAADYATSVTSSRHVLLTTAATSQPSVSLLTLSLSGASSGFSLAAGQTLTLADGGILKTGGGAATIGGGAGLSTTGEYVLRADTAGDQLTIAAPLSGGSGLTKSGLGTLALGAVNGYGGTTTIDAGTLKTTAAGAIPSTSPLVIANAAALDLGGQNQTVAGITLDDGTIQNSAAAAALTLGGNAAGVTYGGVGNGSSISGGALNLASGGASAGSHTFSVARGQGSADLNILADIADGSTNSQTLVKTGNGILQLSGTNSFTGGTQIQAGNLTLGSNYALPTASSLTLSAGTLNLGGYANTAGTLVMQNGLIAGNGSLAAALFNLQNGTLSASLVGNGALSVTTSGVVTITSSNSYSGGSTLSGGTLAVSADNNLGAASGALTLNGGTLQVLGTSFSSTTRPVTMTSNGGAISVADPNNTLTLATQNLNGSGPFTKGGQGGLQLGGSIGSTAITVQDGVLQLTGSASQLSGNPALNLWNVATFAFGNHSESVSGVNLTGGTINTGTGTLNLTGSLNYAQSIWPATIAGNLSLSAAAGVFSVNRGDSTDLTVAANVSGNPAGGLLKTGDGLLTLNGSNTYTGGTTISGGTLQVGNGNVTGSLGSGTVLDGTNSLLSFSPATNLTVPNAITGGGQVAFTGPGKLVFSGSNTYSGGTVIAAGTLQASNTSALPGYNGTGGAITLSGGANLAVNAGGAGEWSAANIDALRSNVTFAAGSALGIDTSDGSFAYGSNIAGALGLIKLGNNTLTLTGNNTYSGTTTITSGTLQMGNGGSSGAPGSGSIVDNAVLLFSRSDTLAIANAVSGSGALVQSGPGTLQLTASNSYSGSTTVTAGTLQIGNGGTSGAPGSGPIIDNAVLLFNRANTLALGNVVSGSGSLVQSGGGTLQLTVPSTYSGGTTISAGILRINADAALGTAPLSPATNITFSGNGTLQAGVATVVLSSNRNIALNSGVTATIDTQSDAMTIPGAISGSGGLTKISNGTLTLSGVNTYSGATTVNAGTLQIPAAGSLGNTAISIGSGATFAPAVGVILGSGGSGSAGATMALNNGAVFDMTSGGIGTFDLDQQSGFAGAALTLGGATLKFDVSGSAADSLLVNTGTVAMSGSNTINIAGLGSSLTPGATYTLISAPSGLNGTFLFPNSSSSEALTVGVTPYKLTLNSSGTAETVHVYGATSYQLAASVANSTIIQGGSTTVTSTIENTGTQTINVPLDYSGLSVALTGGGSLSALSRSGSAISPTSSDFGVCTFTGSAPGTVTLTPTVGSVTNDTIGGSPSGGAAASVNVTVLGHSAPSLSVTTGNDQTVIVGATGISAGLNLSNGAVNQSGLASLDVNSLGTGLSGPTGSRLIASGSAQSYTAALNATAALGLQTQVFSANVGDDHTLPGASASANLSTSATLTVLDHSNASLSPTAYQASQTINFGNVLKGATLPSQSFTVYNDAANTSAAYTANMKLTAFTSNGDAALSTTLATFNGLAAGNGNTYTASLNTNNYTATEVSKTVAVSASQLADDSSLPGAATNNNGGITITLEGNVGSATADNSNSQSSFGAALIAPVLPNASYANLASMVTATAGSGGSDLTGSTATILAGGNGSSSSQTITMQWRTPTLAEQATPVLGASSDAVSSGTLQALDSGAAADGDLIVAAGGTSLSNASAAVTPAAIASYTVTPSVSSDSAISSFAALDAPLGSAAGTSAVPSAVSQSTVSVVPEPGTLLLLLVAGGGGLLWHVRRRKSNSGS